MLGDRVAISGLGSGDSVIASRIDPISPAFDDVIASDAVVESDGSSRIGGRVFLGGRRAPSLSYVTLTGRYTEGSFGVSRTTTGRFSGQTPLEYLLVEGYLTPTAAAPGLRISGLGHSLDADARVSDFSGQWALLAGPYDRQFRFRQAASLPEDLARRQRLMLNAIGRSEILGFSPRRA